ncbi:hypothetical protein EPK84_00830 (plasmid) [Sinorhizobium fredii]|nr:hypothetical protein EPK84_00830 [Sinorhizobium fredii]
MTTATPLARYGAIEGALASGFATALLHHWWGRDHQRFGPICLHGSTKRSQRSRRENLMAGKSLKSARRGVDVARLLAGDRPAPFPNTRWHRTRSCQPEASSS